MIELRGLLKGIEPPKFLAEIHDVIDRHNADPIYSRNGKLDLKTVLGAYSEEGFKEEGSPDLGYSMSIVMTFRGSVIYRKDFRNAKIKKGEIEKARDWIEKMLVIMDRDMKRCFVLEFMFSAEDRFKKMNNRLRYDGRKRG